MMFPDQRHSAFFRHIARAKIHELAAAQAPAAQAGKLRVLARRELEAARAVASDPEDIRQLLHWQRRLERRGRKPKPPPQEPKTVPMFSELEEIES